jgi:hypothetical protein
MMIRVVPDGFMTVRDRQAARVGTLVLPAVTHVRMAGGDARPTGARTRDANLNAQVVMNCVARDDVDTRTEPTVDRSDRAHVQRGPDGMLLPAARVTNARARRYAEVYMVGPAGARVSIESVYEGTHKRQQWLTSNGLAERTATLGQRQRDALARLESRGVCVRGLTRYS